MMGILAQVNWEQAGVFATTVILALGGQKGIEAIISAWRGRQGASRREKREVEPGPGADGDGEYMSRKECLRVHAALDRTLDKLDKGQDCLQAGITRLHERFDEIVKKK
jgi:hypothetical protein